MKYLKILSILCLSFSFFQSIHAQDDEVFMIVEQAPRFPGCEDINGTNVTKENCAQKKMFEYIYANLEYPEEARKNSIEGKVIAQFVVGRRGHIEDIKLVKDIGGGCGEAVIKILESMNDFEKKWRPGKQQGRSVRVKYTLPLNFTLTDDENEEPVEIIDFDNDVVEEVLETEDNKIYKVAEEMPRFPGCENISDSDEKYECAQQKMLTFLYGNMKYPPSARKKGVEGTAVVAFRVNKDGSLSNFALLRDPGEGCGQEALRVIKSMENLSDRWIPGVNKGRVVIVEYVMPVKFKLR